MISIDQLKLNRESVQITIWRLERELSALQRFITDYPDQYTDSGQCQCCSYDRNEDFITVSNTSYRLRLLKETLSEIDTQLNTNHNKEIRQWETTHYTSV
jgi:hypothetical protein